MWRIAETILHGGTRVVLALVVTGASFIVLGLGFEAGWF